MLLAAANRQRAARGCACTPRECARRFAQAAVALALCSGCSRESHKAATKQTLPAAPVARVTREDVRNVVLIASEFRPFQEVDVHAKVAGYVKSIQVDIGDLVHGGQVLATLEVPELHEDLIAARATTRRVSEEVRRVTGDIERVEALADQARLTYERFSAVNDRAPKLVAQQEIDVARSQAEAADADVEANRAALMATEEQLAEAQAAVRRAAAMTNYASITAPFAGIVTGRFADTGAMVPQATQAPLHATPIVRVAQVNPLRLSFPVQEADIPHVHTDSAVKVFIPALQKTLDAKVWRYTGKAEDITRTMETQVLVDNPKFEIKPGMVASVELTLEHGEGVLTIPLEAVTEPGPRARAWVVNAQHRIETRAISTGIRTATRCEVTSGLNQGELVVVARRSEFVAGEHVHPAFAKSVEGAQ